MPANAEAFADEALGGYRLNIGAHNHLVPAGRGGRSGLTEADAVVAAASVAGAVPLEVHDFLCLVSLHDRRLACTVEPQHVNGLALVGLASPPL